MNDDFTLLSKNDNVHVKLLFSNFSVHICTTSARSGTRQHTVSFSVVGGMHRDLTELQVPILMRDGPCELADLAKVQSD